jgi:hypothetical protein
VKTDTHFGSYLAQLFFGLVVFQTIAVENLGTDILCSITCFRKSYRFYEIMWKNIVQPLRPQMTIWRMRIACWIPKATNTDLGIAILIAFPLQQWSHENASLFIRSWPACLFFVL